jgi:hypothetical protein
MLEAAAADMKKQDPTGQQGSEAPFSLLPATMLAERYGDSLTLQLR